MIASSMRSTLLRCLALLTVASACHTTPPEEEIFRGVYEMGPDRSAFIPCASDEQWFVLTGSTAARELRRLTNVLDAQSPGGGMVPRARSAAIIRRAYAEVRGDTVPSPSRNSPLYEHELQLSKVLVVHPAQSQVCPHETEPATTAPTVPDSGR